MTIGDYQRTGDPGAKPLAPRRCATIFRMRSKRRSMRGACSTTYKVGTIGEFAAWTRRVVLEPAAARDVPKTWYDSEGTAKAA